MYNNVITLLTIGKTVNDIGDLVEGVISQKDVFAEVKSIGQSEFYQANATGFKPEIKFVLKDYYDYNDEKQIIYNEITYTVLRTYRNNNEIELTCYRGVNNASS